MDSQLMDYPHTVEEMLERGWYEKILAKVKKYQLNDILNSPEEIVQDVFTQIISSQYLSRFDPTKRSFEVYIYTLVINTIKKRGTREGTKNGKYIVNHNTLEYSQDDSDVPTNGVTFLDRVENKTLDDPYSEVEMQELLERTKDSLREFKASSSVWIDGKEVKRDAVTVLELLMLNYSVPEIAEIFKTSKQFIYILLNRIRETPEMQAFHGQFQNDRMISERGQRRKKSWANATF